MNIFFFTKHDLQWGSSRERIGNYFVFLKKEGHVIQALSLLPRHVSERFISPSSHSGIMTLLLSIHYNFIHRYLKWAWLFLNAKRFNRIIIQKINLPSFLIQLLKYRNKHIFFDFDDLCIVSRYEKRDLSQKFFQKKNFIQTSDALRPYSHVISGNPTLLKISHEVKPISETTLIPTAIDTSLYHPLDLKNNTPLVIGWTGSGENHYENLKLLVKPLQALSNNHPFCFHIIGSLYSKKIKALFASASYETRFTEWVDPNTLATLTRQFDIGVMPLVNTPDTNAKCGFKILAYMASGVVPVASPIGINSDIIQEGYSGFLAQNTEEWITKLEKLITNSHLRSQISKNGKHFVDENYSLKRTAQLFVKTLTAGANR